MKETLLEINGVEISPNMPVTVSLRRIRSTEVDNKSEVVFVSTDRIYTEDELNFVVWIREKKSFQGIFRRGVRWGLECETIDQMVWAKVSVAMDGEFLMREKVRLGRKQIYPKLPTIPEEDEEEEEAMEEMADLGSLNYVVKKKNGGGDGEMKKGVSWIVNVGIFVTCLGVGLFVSRASFRRLAGLKF